MSRKSNKIQPVVESNVESPIVRDSPFDTPEIIQKGIVRANAIADVLTAEMDSQDVPVEFVVAEEPVNSRINLNEFGGYGDVEYAPATLLPHGEYYVSRPTRAQVKRDGNDLGRAVTLILQLLPLTDHPQLLPEESHEIQQLLLKAGYLLETADCTPSRKCKVELVA